MDSSIVNGNRGFHRIEASGVKPGAPHDCTVHGSNVVSYGARWHRVESDCALAVTPSEADRSEILAWRRRLAATPPDPTTRALGAALALGAASRFTELELLYRAALESGVSGSDLAEGALALHLFGGFPRAIEAFFALSEAGGCVAPPLDPRGAEQARTDGERLFGAIYGKQAGAVRARLGEFAPDFDRAVIEDAYGRILSRPALGGARRELAAVCALAALGLDRQLFSHVRGALALGCDAESITAMVELAGELSPATSPSAAATSRRALGEAASSDVTPSPE
jgi:4-carboxymuconolactone decarboxylase